MTSLWSFVFWPCCSMRRMWWGARLNNTLCEGGECANEGGGGHTACIGEMLYICWDDGQTQRTGGSSSLGESDKFRMIWLLTYTRIQIHVYVLPLMIFNLKRGYTLYNIWFDSINLITVEHVWQDVWMLMRPRDIC